MAFLDYNAPALRPTKGCGFVARVELDHGDRVFKPGDPYPYAELGKHEVDAVKMFRAGLLAVAAPAATDAPTIVATDPPPSTSSPASTVADDRVSDRKTRRARS
jgi:hypothetical protein